MLLRLDILRSTVNLLLLALGLALVMAVELTAANGTLKAFMESTLPWHAPVMTIAMVLAATFAILNAFTATLKPSPGRIAGTIASTSLALIAGLEATHAVSPLPLRFYFAANLIGQVCFTFAMSTAFLSCLKIAGRWGKTPVHVAAATVGLVGILGFAGQSWVSLERVALVVNLVRDVSLGLIPLVLLAIVGFYRPMQLSVRNAKDSICHRLALGPDNRNVYNATLLMAAGMVFGGLVTLLTHATGGAESASQGIAPLLTFSWGWIGIAFLSLTELAQFTAEQRQGNVTARLAPTPARQFLKRHLTEKQAWAATVGLKTTNFIIDHDPGDALHRHLPASIMQIRAEEIQRCVTEVLGSMYLHSHVSGSRIFGAVDPETSVRPCIDTLRMFACLYLDAGPLVERRIKGLTALLPIVDPGLAKVMGPKDVSSLIRRNLWFFHFDFGWIDQHVIHTPRSTRYDVRLTTLGSKVRHSMMDYLEKTGGVGNFVWLGPEARDRILQEAPSMRNIIEACPVAVGDTNSPDESLMFTMKFEQLIPRLQRYFDLDTLRQSLLDFEPSQESARLLSLLGLQIDKAKNPEEVVDVLSSLTSVPWRGFREKDHALQLILAAYEQLIRFTPPGVVLAETNDAKLRLLHERLMDAVRIIGYPSQILHNAQISKIALRDVDVLVNAASDPSHSRFSEAWLLMGTTDYHRHTPDQRRALLKFLGQLARKGRVGKERLVQVKAVDALAGLGRAAKMEERQDVADAATHIAEWFAHNKVDPDICCLFLDSQVYLTNYFGPDLLLSTESTKHLDTYFQALTAELGVNHPKVIAVMSRWQDFRVRKLADNAA